ncbi:glutamate-gated chloride channel [Trichonephila clavipes]|nr:glutamate-gated chloride channel [Trichonephila clavipes]
MVLKKYIKDAHSENNRIQPVRFTKWHSIRVITREALVETTRVGAKKKKQRTLIGQIKYLRHILLHTSVPFHEITPTNIQQPTLTNITVNVLLHSLSSPDESSLSYEVEFLLYRTWTDERLQYEDNGRHRYLNGMSHVDHIWLPNTYIVKHGSLKDPLVDMSLRVYRNGTIVHILRRGISINCQGNLKIFPFDNPKCPFAIESGKSPWGRFFVK